MNEPFEGVWLPRDIRGFGAVKTAYGDLEVEFTSEFYGYGKSETSTKYRFAPRDPERKRNR